MNLFKVIHNNLRGWKRSLIALFVNPIENAKVAIEDSEKIIANFTEKIARLAVQGKVQAAHLKHAQDDVTKYRSISAKALAQNNDADSVEALRLADVADQRATAMVVSIDRSKATLEKLSIQLEAAQLKVRKAHAFEMGDSKTRTTKEYYLCREKTNRKK